jgi:asparagine synthase (glutamine-hydrolysing)
MIKTYKLTESEITLTSDLASEFPIYIYQSKDKKNLHYTDSIVKLLTDEKIKKPLKVSRKGISFLLQSGVVPPPYTVYENIYILGIGDTVNIKTVNNKIELTFSHEFPFFSENRLTKNKMKPDEDIILKLIADATIERIDTSKETFLFHSAGKDSNTIAIALAKAGWQDKVTLITHKSKGDKDESEISKSIAKELGFKHKILYEVDELSEEHKKAIDEYFINAPFPCTDNVTLAYPLYTVQMPELRDANIIDGGGNDVYMMTPPSSRDLKMIQLSRYTSKASFLRSFIPSESKIMPFLRTPAEWCGMSGFSYADTKSILNNTFNVYEHWNSESKKRYKWDIYDFKTDLFATKTIAEVHIRKFLNFTDVIGANSLTPFANEKVATYFATMPEEYLFNRKTLKNKLILRSLLKNKIGLDSDKIGKIGFSYDSKSVVLQNWRTVTEEIYSCKVWNKVEVESIVERMRKSMNGKSWRAGASSRLIYRLYLISAWLNKNKWL